MRFVREVRTETGYMMVSSPLMTALDLVQNERKVGGLGRVTEVLLELCRKIGVKFAYVALKASVEKHDGDEPDERWKVIVNYEFDIDEI